jgi:hypothetical protein
MLVLPDRQCSAQKSDPYQQIARHLFGPGCDIIKKVSRENGKQDNNKDARRHHQDDILDNRRNKIQKSVKNIQHI